MASLKVLTAKLTGNPGESGWTQIHDFTPEDEEKLAKRGRLFAVISAKIVEEGVDAVITGREILSRLHEEYFGEKEMSAFNALKKAVEKVLDEYPEGEVEIAACSLLNEIIYSATGGGGEAAIFRNGMLASVLKSKKNEAVSASGNSKEGDVFLLGTSSFFQKISGGVIKGALETGGPAEAIETLTPMVHAGEDSGNLGLVIIEFSGKEKEEGLPIIKEKEKEPIDRKSISPTNLVGSLSEKMSLFKLRIPRRKIFIKKGEIEAEEAQSKKTAFTIGTILLFLLAISIVFGVRQKGISDFKSGYEERLTKAEHQLEEAKSLFSLNPDRARELFSESRSAVEELEKEGIEDERLTKLRNDLKETTQSILGEYEISSEQFIDLTLLIEGFKGDQITASSKDIYVLDKEGKRIVAISFETKKTEVVSGPAQIKDPLALASYEDRTFVLEGDGIYEVGQSREMVVEKDWGEALIYAYAGNIYLLDRSISDILRFPGVEDGFASGKSWLAPGIEPNFDKAVSMSVDGNIWVLTSTGKLEKYSLGSPKALALNTNWVNPVDVYSNEETEGVYILDPDSSRLIVLDKEGNYIAQYKDDSFKEAKEVVVSEEQRKAIFLTKEKLYSIDLVHLEQP